LIGLVKYSRMYGLSSDGAAALAAISNRFDPEQEPLIREDLSAFLNRVYHDLRNLGQTSRDRALNFAATNIFQSASVFAEAIASFRQLDTIEVKKSPYCRIKSLVSLTVDSFVIGHWSFVITSSRLLRSQSHRESLLGWGNTNVYGHEVEIPGGCRVVYRPDNPRCGAKVWIETLYDVRVISWQKDGSG